MTDRKAIEAAVDALVKKAMRHGLCQTKTTREDLDKADTALLTLIEGVFKERDLVQGLLFDVVRDSNTGYNNGAWGRAEDYYIAHSEQAAIAATDEVQK